MSADAVSEDADAATESTTVGPIDADSEAGVEVGYGPTSTSRAIAVAAAAVATLTTAPFSLPSLPFGLLGLVAFVHGLYAAETRTWVTRGVAGIFAGMLVAAAVGALTTGAMLFSIAALLVAWFTGQNALDFGAQLGTHADTRRAELFQAGAVAGIAVLSAAVAYITFSLAADGQPAIALTLLLVGSLTLVFGLRI